MGTTTNLQLGGTLTATDKYWGADAVGRAAFWGVYACNADFNFITHLYDAAEVVIPQGIVLDVTPDDGSWTYAKPSDVATWEVLYGEIGLIDLVESPT